MFDFVFLDLETTGTNPKQDKIIEVGMIIRLKNGEREIFESLVKPGLPVPSFVKRLTGIDDEMLKEAPALEDIKPTLLKLLENRVLVAHNAIFDVAFLERALGIEIAQKSLDTLELCRLIYPQFNSYQLRNLAREFSLEPGNSHRALADALLLEKLFDHLYGELKKLSLQALEDIEAIFGDSEEMLALLCRQALRERVRMYDFTQPLNGKRQDEEAHKPSRAIGWNLQAVEKMFLPGGCVARGLKVYQHRDQQVKMLKAVGKAFQQNRHLLVEAGTGIGKSLAYLVPAIHWAVAQGEKVVVATHTIALQEQLIKSDIVFLQKNLDTAFKAAVLKGRSNYLCLFKWRTIKQNVQAFNWPEKVLMARISLWLKQNHTGDRDHINLREWEVDLYQQLSSQSENCLGQDCPFVRECFYQEAKKKAQAADVIIVNHSLLLADLKLGENILPPYQYLIVDEAHHLEEEGTKQFSEVFSLREFIKKLANLTTRRDLATRSGVLYYWKRHFSTRRDRDERLSAEMLDCISRAEALSKKINATADEIKEYCLSLEPLDTIRIQAGTTSEKWWCALGLLFDNLMLETAGILDCLKQLLNGINMEADAEETAPLRALGT